MSAHEPSSITEWLQNLPIPWLVGGSNGRAEVTAYGGVVDAEIATLKVATKARMPDYAPDAAALAHIGAERGIFRGPAETSASYAARLKAAWDNWSRAGNAPELLLALWFAGWEGATLVTQNGLRWYVVGTPVPAGAYNTDLVAGDLCGLLATALTSGATPSQTPIPAGQAWWVFDSNTANASRFAVILNTSCTNLQTFAKCSFSASNTATATWNKPLDSSLTYSTLISAPTITDGSGGVALSLAAATDMTSTGITLTASEAFTGTATVWAYPAGSNPFTNYTAAAAGQFAAIVRAWRPARAACTTAIVPTTGQLWGWPVRTWGAGNNWGPCEAVTLPGPWA